MSEVNVQIQNPTTAVNIQNPQITIEIPNESIQIEIQDGQPIEIQVQNPVIEVNIGGPCNCEGGGGVWGEITGTLSDQTDLQTALDGKSDTGHTHPLSDLEQSGATTGQVAKWNGSEWAPADDETGGGGATIESDTYENWETARAAGELTPGATIIVTDRADLGMILQVADVNAFGVSGIGGFLNADFQVVGDYSGVVDETGIAAGTQHGIWRQSFEALTITYTNLAGGTFAVGDTITGANTGATAVILTDDGAASMTAYMTSQGVAFDGSEQLDNGAGVTADQDGAATGPTIQEGDVVIWNLLHWQLTNAANLDGTDPETNVSAYVELPKASANVGYVEEWDIVEFDWANDSIQYRQDLRGNKIVSANAVSKFTWGNSEFYDNQVLGGEIDLKNATISVFGNNVYTGAYIRNVSATSGEVSNNLLASSCYIYNIESGDGLYISGNFITGNSGIFGINSVSGLEIGTNTIGNEGYIGNNCIANSGLQIYSNIVYGTLADNCTFESDVQVNQNTVYKGSSITLSSFGNSSIVENNIFENGGLLTSISTGANCSISKNKVGPGAILGTGSTLGDSCTVNDNVLGASAEMINLTLAELSVMNGNNIGGGGAIRNIELQAGGEAQCSFNNLSTDAFIDGIVMGAGGRLSSNIVKAGGTITDITAGESCSIQRNEVGQGATLGGNTTIGDSGYIDKLVLGTDAAITNSTIGIDAGLEAITFGQGASVNLLNVEDSASLYESFVNSVFSNKTIESGIEINKIFFEIQSSASKSFSSAISEKRALIGFSNFDETIDITGLTTLDCLAENNYVGIFNLTSSNATESIDTITNPPTAFPFILRPAAGLTLTITGTAYAGIASGQIALKAADYTLDGDKGEYIVLEIDPLGTGALIEKQVVNGLI